MGKIIRRVIAILLAVTGIIIAVIPAGNVDATSVHGDYEYDGSTLVKYLGHESVLTIPNWITRVGKDAFADNTELRKINLPDSVSTIDYQAFKGCVNLQEAVIPDSVRTIGSSAFSGCVSLYSISIPEKCESIGSGAFAGCISLSDISVDPYNQDFICLDGVLYSRDGSKLVQYLAGRPFTGYAMPTTNKEIEEYAFWGAPNLNKLEISPGVDAIPEYAFSNCSGLTKVSVPNSVERINAYAFSDCNNLESINIPESIGYIDPRAFYMTDGTIIYFVNSQGDIVRTANSSDVSSYATGADESNDNVVNSDFTSEGSDNNQQTGNDTEGSEGTGVSALTSGLSTAIPATVNNSSSGKEASGNDSSANEIGSGVIVGGNAMLMISSHIPVKGFDLDSAEQEDDYFDDTYAFVTNSDSPVVGNTYVIYKGTEQNVSIPSEVEKIGNRAFYKNQSVNSVSLPDNLNTIGEFAFARSSIKEVLIPEGTKTLDYAAFYRCPELSEVTIPSSVNDIKLGAFDETPYLNNFLQGEGEDFLIVGDSVLLGYRGPGGDITIPEGVKHIAAGAFSGNESITGVVIPSTVEDVGEEAFCGCTRLNKLTLNEGIKDIKDRAFKGTGLTCVYLPDSVENLGLGSFDTSENSSTLKSVILAGNDVPNVSYENTATRLSATDLRACALNGVQAVIVSKNCDLFSGSLFNPGYYGFDGQVYTKESSEVKQEVTDEAQGEDEALDSRIEGQPETLLLELSLTPTDSEGTVIIDPHVDVAGQQFIMGNVKDSAFAYYKEWNKYFDNMPVSIVVNGNRSEELDNLLKSVTESANSTVDVSAASGNNGDTGENKDAGSVTQFSNIKCRLISEAFEPFSSAIAVIPDNSEDFCLTISDDRDDSERINSAFETKYGYKPDSDMVMLSFDLTDKKGTVPIHKLGNNKMEVEMPMPSSLSGKEGITVGTFDDNGALEEIATDVFEDESGVRKIRFLAGHCSPYFIYSKSQMLNVYIERSVSSDEAIGTPSGIVGVWNTLQKKTPVGISAKWFVVVILFALAGIFALFNPKKAQST